MASHAHDIGRCSMSRTRIATTSEFVSAVLASPELYEIAAGETRNPGVGRPRELAPWSVLLLGVLARHFRSAARAEAELRSDLLWRHVQAQADRARDAGFDVPDAPRPPTWTAWRRARDHAWATDEGLARIARIHLEHATALARSLELGVPEAGGSWSHPSRSRAVYGDGTLVRPLYIPPPAIRTVADDGTVTVAYPDPVTGELRDTPGRRYDPDCAEHHGHTGPVHGINYVAWHMRGPRPYQRVILHVTAVPGPGQEADTAVRSLAEIRAALGDGVQVVVYDGALRGVHIEAIMRRYGYVVLCKPPTETSSTATPSLLRLPGGRAARSTVLGTWEHAPGGRRCLHHVAAVDGAPCEIALDETGDPALVAQLARRQVKRPRGKDGRYRFSAAYEIPCTQGPFWVWLSPHAERGDADAHRAETFRIITAGDPDGARLYGIRSDAESHHSQFKQTLRNSRAMSLGAARGLLDQYAYALGHNAVIATRNTTAATTGGLRVVPG